MNKYLLLIPAFGWWSVTGAQAQTKLTANPKTDVALSAAMPSRQPAKRLLPGRKMAAQRKLQTSDEKTVSMVVSVNDSEAAVRRAAQLGGRSRVVSPTAIVAHLPASRVEAFVKDASVKHASLSRQAKLHNDQIRLETEAGKVQTGAGLETPFTGKGVIVGIMDAGFQYNHIAFKDAEGKSRILGTWEQDDDLTTSPSVGAPVKTYDGVKETGGHATHVMGIAAGSKVGTNNFYGLAPEADLITVSTNGYDDGMLSGLSWMIHVADSLQKPIVMNMSLGSITGPHDGTTDFDQAADGLLGAGHLLTASMGNEGDLAIHSQYVFSHKDEETILLLTPDTEFFLLDLWEDTPSTGENALFEYVPIIYNPTEQDPQKAIVEVDITDQDSYLYFGLGRAEATQKVNCTLAGYTEDLISKAGLDGLSSFKKAALYPGLRIVCKDKASVGAGFHAWADADEGCEFEVVEGITTARPDATHIVGQGGASIPRAFGVGAYVTRKTWTSLSNETYSISLPSKGALADFSSVGPSLGNDLKPTVCAPGAVILSPLNRYVPVDDESTTFQMTSAYVTAAVDNSTGSTLNYPSAKSKGKTHCDFYGAMQGTSMSSPAVAGVVALWLQACPTLTPEQTVEIIRKTSKRDSFVGETSQDWNNRWGYGKINAYEGLKEALKLQDQTGICCTTMTQDKPVTLSKETGMWKVLFNVPVSQCKIELLKPNGQAVSQQVLQHVKTGEEQLIPLDHLPAGVYLINISTPGASQTRKVIVP